MDTNPKAPLPTRTARRVAPASTSSPASSARRRRRRFPWRTALGIAVLLLVAFAA